MKKLISLLICCVIAAGGLASCASGAVRTDEAQSTAASGTTVMENAAENEHYISGLPENYDLDGFVLNILNRKPISTTLNTFYVSEQNGETINDAIFRRNLSVCEKYNFSINEQNTDTVVSAVKNAVLAGDGTYHAAIDQLSTAAGVVFQNIFYDTFEIPYINYDKYYWNQDFADAVSIGGKLYYLVGDIMLSDEDMVMVTMYNISLAKDFNIKENMYQTVLDGNWTFDKMISYAKLVAADLNGDSEYTTADRYGVFYADNSAAAPYFSASDITFISKNDSDIPQVSFNTERAEKVFTTVKNMLSDKTMSYNWGNIKENTANVISSMITNKQLLFQHVILSYARRNLRDVEGDIGFLPLPKFDETQNHYSSLMNYAANVVMFVPRSNPDIEKTGFALEALCAGSSSVTDAYINTCLASKYTRDAESYDMVRLTMKNTVIDLAFVYKWGGFSDALTSAVMDASSNFSSLYASYETKIKADMDASLKELK